ncbi:MAG: hypothetical protein PUF97_05760 [Bifidobacteriaceae bacterium]|nr:hypothetical protein [Bifidobacteriaceae bacterium]
MRNKVIWKSGTRKLGLPDTMLSARDDVMKEPARQKKIRAKEVNDDV